MVQHYHNPQSGLLNHAKYQKGVLYTMAPPFCVILTMDICMVNWS
jgi:hypothetical protein